MESKKTIIILIILLSIVIVGLIAFLIIALNGNLRIGAFRFNDQKAEQIILEEKYNEVEIENIEVLSNAGEVIVKESEDNIVYLKIYGEDEQGAETRLNGKTLNINNTKRRKSSWFSFNSSIDSIVIYVPKTYVGQLDIKNDYGNCEITDLENATIKADVDCGNVKLGKVKNAELRCDYGDIDIGTILNKCNIRMNCGNVKIQEVSVKEESSIKCDLGDVKIDKANDVYIDGKVDLGDTKIENNNRHASITLKVEVDCGDIKVGN